MQKLVLILLLLTGFLSADGQKKWQKMGFKPAAPVCYGSGKTEKSFIPPPAQALERLKSGEKKSEFIVEYDLFPEEAIKAFDFAVSIWEGLIESPVPIHIKARWLPKGLNVLGSCGPNDYEVNFEGAPRKDVYYPIAVAEKILGKELTDANQPDMTAEFNKNIKWHFKTDGATPDSLYDFVSVVLHEIAHGLGFTGFYYVNGTLGGYGNNYWDLADATSFDQLVVNPSGSYLVDESEFNNPSLALKNALVSGELYAHSPAAHSHDGENYPRLYAPSSWNDGSSIYHLNDDTYPANNIISLMTHAAGKGEATFDPGPLTLGIMADFGWKIMRLDFEELKDREEIGTVDFEVGITSDYPIDTSALFVVFSVDSFSTTPDSLPLSAAADRKFAAQFVPDSNLTHLSYYITAGDQKNRTFTSPSEAPGEFFSMHFGPDSTPPVIQHEPIPYYFSARNELAVTAQVTDNLGTDSVYVEYAINGEDQKPFALSPGSGSSYSGSFNFQNIPLNDGDEITYKIVAKDSASAGNTGFFPSDSTFSFRVEKAFEPQSGYVHDFDNPTSDFILSDFDIYTESQFENGALHSPHPYPSPNMDDTEFNFSTLLKYPIILGEDATMTFDEIVLVEPGSTGTSYGDFEFWDYAIVEGSKDNGETWHALADGYDSRARSVWNENYEQMPEGEEMTNPGIPDWFIRREIKMTENSHFSAGDTIFIRFRLFSDPYANGWGWAIDNLRIQTPVSSPPILSPGNIMAYPNPFSGSFSVTIDPKPGLNEIQIEVYDMFGRKVRNILHANATSQVTTKIDIGTMAKGIYLLSVKANGKQITTRKMVHN